MSKYKFSPQTAVSTITEICRAGTYANLDLYIDNLVALDFLTECFKVEGSFHPLELDEFRDTDGVRKLKFAGHPLRTEVFVTLSPYDKNHWVIYLVRENPELNCLTSTHLSVAAYTTSGDKDAAVHFRNFVV